jgi:toxin ParE1/3/4|tara:strand:+ start:2646 stop:2939 length:294 start_codon:yes stop_codon:yes gene_type:complete
MKIVFLPAALEDLEWMRKYYRDIFPEGKKNAARHYRSAMANLEENPLIGSPSEAVPELREYPIARTPFSLTYQLRRDEIRILQVKDQRSARPTRIPK